MVYCLFGVMRLRSEMKGMGVSLSCNLRKVKVWERLCPNRGEQRAVEGMQPVCSA